MNLIVSALVSVLVSTLLLIVGSALIEAMRRRGFDPIARLATIISPTDVMSANAGV